MKHVTIYSTPTCGYCYQAKEFMQEHHIPYEEKDVAQDMAARQEMVAKTHQLGVPVIDVEGQLMVGWSEAKFQEMLGVA